MENLFLLAHNISTTCVSFGNVCFPHEHPGRASCCSPLICAVNSTSNSFFCACDEGFSWSSTENICKSDGQAFPEYAIYLIVYGAIPVFFLLVSFVLYFILKIKERVDKARVAYGDAHPLDGIGTVRCVDTIESLQTNSHINFPQSGLDDPEPNNRSLLHTILINGIAETESPNQTIIDVSDLPPSYPGPPPEDLPPTYEEAFFKTSIR